MKVLHSICQQIWKTQQWPQDWKRSVFIPIPKKGNAKESSYYHTVVFGRVGVPRAFYEMQDALCALPWLWDYEAREEALLASVAPDAPPDARELLRGLAGGAAVELRRTPPEAAALLRQGKRIAT